MTLQNTLDSFYRTERRAVATLVVLVFLAYFGVYFVGHLTGRPAQSREIHYAYLAKAFLNGRLDVQPDSPDRLSELVPHEGKLYVVYPPFPGVVLMPFVALMGPDVPTGIVSILFAAAGISFLYLWLRRLEQPASVAWWTAFLFAFGTSFWHTSIKGASWLMAHTLAAAFMTAALYEASGRKRGFYAGILFGMALLCRLPVALAFPVVLYFLLEKSPQKLWRAFFFCLGVGFFVLLNMAYNWLRFGTVSNAAYTMIPGVLSQGWYDKGILHLSYIPRNLYAIFFQPPVLTSDFPFFVPSLFGLSVFFTTPAMLLVFLSPARRKLTWILAAGVLLSMFAGLVHGWPGGAQFGYRFSLDAFPFLAALTAFGMRGRVSYRIMALIFLSVFIGLWGLLYIRPVPVQWLYPVYQNVS
jgi:Dolichyl-phosphate-mannose-protein mannosyltransferase